MLSDLAKVHTGFGIIPAVANGHNEFVWGQPGNTKLVDMAPTWFSKKLTARDTIVAREENHYWKWVVSEFSKFGMGFQRFEAEWWVWERSPRSIEVVYRYTNYAHSAFYPFHWMITKTIWRAYMRHVLQNVKRLAEGDEPFFFN